MDFGHELGHYVLKHILRGMIFMAAMLLALLYLGYRSIGWCSQNEARPGAFVGSTTGLRCRRYCCCSRYLGLWPIRLETRSADT